MWIFYKQLPRGTTTRAINRITLKGSKPRYWFTSLFNNNIVKRCKIILIKDPRADSSEYHALVQVDSPKTAAHIIENLDGKTVNGLYLKPHRYHRRFPSRDRRNHEMSYRQQQERRQGDRRRSGLVTRVMETS